MCAIVSKKGRNTHKKNILILIAKNNYITAAYQPDLLSFGFTIKKNYITFNATEKINFRFRYPKDFMEFVWKGNGGLLGQDLNFPILHLIHFLTTFGIRLLHQKAFYKILDFPFSSIFQFAALCSKNIFSIHQ